MASLLTKISADGMKFPLANKDDPKEQLKEVGVLPQKVKSAMISPLMHGNVRKECSDVWDFENVRTIQTRLFKGHVQVLLELMLKELICLIKWDEQYPQQVHCSNYILMDERQKDRRYCDNYGHGR